GSGAGGHALLSGSAGDVRQWHPRRRRERGARDRTHRDPGLHGGERRRPRDQSADRRGAAPRRRGSGHRRRAVRRAGVRRPGSAAHAVAPRVRDAYRGAGPLGDDRQRGLAQSPQPAGRQGRGRSRRVGPAGRDHGRRRGRVAFLRRPNHEHTATARGYLPADAGDPVDALIREWLNVGLRWIHLIAGIGWIGTSLYFMWLDAALTKPKPSRPSVEGETWLLHSGGFYLVER